MTPRRAYGLALLLLAVGSVLVLAAAGRSWASASLSGGAARSVDVAGHDVLPALPALAVLALAGVGAVVATGGWVRRVVGALLTLLGVVIAALSLVSDDRAATVAALHRANADVAAVLAWDTDPLARGSAVLGGLLVAAGGLWVVVRGAQWPTLGSRYARAPRARVHSTDPWTALDAGIDPTLDIADPAAPPGPAPDTISGMNDDSEETPR